MAPPKKGTKEFKIRLQLDVVKGLMDESINRGALSPNALAARWIEEKLRESTTLAPEIPTKPAKAAPEIDLRELLLAAHRDLSEAHRANAEASRTIAEQARTISTLTHSLTNSNTVTTAESVRHTSSIPAPAARTPLTPNATAGTLLG